MKLLIATPLYPPDIGGPATDAALLSSSLPPHGIDTTVVSFTSVRHLPRGIRHVVYALKLFASVRGAQAIVALDTFSVAVPALAVAWVCRIPLVLRVPGDYAWEQATQRYGVSDSIEIFQTRQYGLMVETIRVLQRFVARRSALVMVPSDFFKRIVATWGVRPERLARTYLGANLGGEVVAPQEVPAGKILFSVGRLVPWKGFLTLVKLMRDLPAEWHLVIAGEGPDKSLFVSTANASGVADRVTFTGALPRAEVLGWLHRADAFALNTSFESFSFQILEAMASGVPVITTTIGSIPELIDNGVEGVLCAPDSVEEFTDAIVSTTSEPELWRVRTLAARKKAALFSAEHAVTAFAEAIRPLCA